jgi:diguanylate cyclase (GGDEF)-like protein
MGVQEKRGTAAIEWIYPLKRRILLSIYAVFGLLLVAAVVFVLVMLRRSLIEDNRRTAEELGGALATTLGSMMTARDPGLIQETLEAVAKGGGEIAQAFIIDVSGTVRYSSDPAAIGAVLDRFVEPACRACHREPGAMPPRTTIAVQAGGGRVMRHVEVVYNQKRCFGCHPREQRVNGKVVVDRSLAGTTALIVSVGLIIIFSGLLCLVLSYPLLSRGVDRYIREIVRQNSELLLLYLMVERLSKTIDLGELREIVAEIVRDTFGADDVHIVFTSEGGGFHCYTLDGATLRRGRIEDDEALHRDVRAWLRYEIETERIAADRRTILLPIAAGGRQVALIAARRAEGAFEVASPEALRVISGHIGTALENARLYVLAITDELTGLFSYRHFTNAMSKQAQRHKAVGERFSLLMIDLDDFKALNDTWGHEDGNRVLALVADRIRYCTRDSDVAFRYGGEEFAVILPGTPPDGARLVAERIRRTVEAEPFALTGGTAPLTVSIGVSSCPPLAGDVGEVVTAADRALYAAKTAGKNRTALAGD